jgi:hypothetical protein
MADVLDSTLATSSIALSRVGRKSNRNSLSGEWARNLGLKIVPRHNPLDNMGPRPSHPHSVRCHDTDLRQRQGYISLQPPTHSTSKITPSYPSAPLFCSFLHLVQPLDPPHSPRFSGLILRKRSLILPGDLLLHIPFPTQSSRHILPQHHLPLSLWFPAPERSEISL